MYQTTTSDIGSFYHPKNTFHDTRLAPQEVIPPGHKWTTVPHSTGVCASQEQFLRPHPADPMVKWGQTLQPGTSTQMWQTQSIARFPKAD